MASHFFKNRRLNIAAGAVIIIIFLGVLLIRHRHKGDSNAASSQYVESYTAGLISKTSVIHVKLSNDVATTHARNEPVNSDVFDFSPSVKGKAYWADERTIEFKPEKDLVPDAAYNVEVDLSKIIEAKGDQAHFKFDFKTFKPDYTISFEGLQTATNTSLDRMKLTGIIQMADKEDPALVEKMITKTYPSEAVITWKHNAANNTHTFIINNILRTNQEQKLDVQWDGSVLNIDGKDHKTYDIPAVGDFKVLNFRAVQDHDQYVEVHFSNPILVGQELTGLTGINNVADIAYTIDGSLVKIYAPDHLDGNYYPFANEGIKDISGKKITTKYSGSVYFENRLPTVSIPGKGVILPGTSKLTMPFEAANLTAVDVSIVKVYENNVPQFLQNNDFNGEDQLRQVAKPVVQTTIRLDKDKTLT